MTCTLVALPATAVTPPGAPGSLPLSPSAAPPRPQDVIHSMAQTTTTTRRTVPPPRTAARQWSGPIWPARDAVGKGPAWPTGGRGYVC